MKYSAQSVLLLSLSLSGLSSCSLLPNRPEPPAVHDFGPFSPTTIGYPWAQAEVIAPDWLQDSRIHYRLLYTRSTEVRSYSRDSWVAPPAVLMAHRFNGSQRSGNYRLHIELQKLGYRVRSSDYYLLWSRSQASRSSKFSSSPAGSTALSSFSGIGSTSNACWTRR